MEHRYTLKERKETPMCILYSYIGRFSPFYVSK